MTVLVADIGGTNTRVALCDSPETPRDVARFANREFDSLDAVLRHYLAGLGGPACDAACVAVAGPVRDGVGALTNLDWRIDAAALREATGAGIAHVVNDLEAQGHALDDVDTSCVMGTEAADPAGHTRLVVGIGTGFNAAPVHPATGSGAVSVVQSECGHIGLPVWDADTLALSRFLADRHGFASVEEALAGRGILAINAHLAGDAARADSRALVAALTGTPSATDAATANLYCAILGQVLSDQALIHLPWGGIYLIGGLARAMAPVFDRHGLSEAFHHKGRFSGFLRDFSLHVVDDDYAALTGCARYVARHA